MGARVVEGTGLENRHTSNRIVGSNPTPSAICINMDKRIINKQVIIENYSEKNSVIYDNNINKNFLYGNATKKFIKNIKLKLTQWA